MATESGVRVWRVHWWVPLILVDLLGLAILVQVMPQWFHQGWADGVPAAVLPWMIGADAVLALLILSMYRSRIILSYGQAQVINGWRTHRFAASEVIDIQPQPWGVRFDLVSGHHIKAIAIQERAVHRGPDPRWAGIARSFVDSGAHLPPHRLTGQS